MASKPSEAIWMAYAINLLNYIVFEMEMKINTSAPHISNVKLQTNLLSSIEFS